MPPNWPEGKAAALLSFMYVRIAMLLSVPKELKSADLILFDQLARKFDRFVDRRAVVDAYEVDLAAVYFAEVVDHLKICRLGATFHPVFREQTRVRSGVADFDLGVRGAGVVFLPPRRRCGGKGDGEHCRQEFEA